MQKNKGPASGSGKARVSVNPLHIWSVHSGICIRCELGPLPSCSDLKLLVFCATDSSYEMYKCFLNSRYEGPFLEFLIDQCHSFVWYRIQPVLPHIRPASCLEKQSTNVLSKNNNSYLNILFWDRKNSDKAFVTTPCPV